MKTRLEITYRVNFSTALHIGTGMGFAKMIDDLFARRPCQRRRRALALHTRLVNQRQSAQPL